MRKIISKLQKQLKTLCLDFNHNLGLTFIAAIKSETKYNDERAIRDILRKHQQHNHKFIDPNLKIYKKFIT